MIVIGLIAMSGKPVTAGHWSLIERASAECDDVRVFVSTASRKRKGEFPIDGNDMRLVWDLYLHEHVPANTRISFVANPVRSVYAFLGDESENHAVQSKFRLYGDPTDLVASFPDVWLAKYAPNIHDQIARVGVDRATGVDISATRMRGFLMSGDHDAFIDNLPRVLSRYQGLSIWKLLRSRAF